MQKNLTLFQVNTTAYDEEDFLLVTDLNDEEIERVIKPIVYDERVNGVEYDNEQLITAIKKAHPKATIYGYTPNQITFISV